jgi:predicted dehydrogenase
MTFDLGEALALRELVKKSGKIFALTHNYTGYPIVKQARELVQRGGLGKILKVVAESLRAGCFGQSTRKAKSKRCGGLTQSKRVLPLASLTLALTQRILHDILHL